MWVVIGSSRRNPFHRKNRDKDLLQLIATVYVYIQVTPTVLRENT
jgi:hypothetical protein